MTSVKLSAKWQLDAALLSRPVDLTALVTMSRSTPEKFLEDSTLNRLVTSLLNEKNDKKSDRDTKLDVLNILANVAIASKTAVTVVRGALQSVSEWFDEYMVGEEDHTQEPDLHKAMVLLLARCWDYKIKTEDVLELTHGNRKIALCTVVGLLEDGETYSTELKQRQKPEAGKMGQWEHELVVHRYEKPLLLQICRLLRGFTHPGTYFDSSSSSSSNGSAGADIALFSVERFAEEIDTLLEITLRSSLVEKLSLALYDCLFEVYDDEVSAAAGGVEAAADGNGNLGNSEGFLEEYDHIAISSVHAFLQNLYFYATTNTVEYRRHMLMETVLITRLVLPYLDKCVIHATILNTRAEAYADMLEGDCVAEMALHNPHLVKGIAASLRTLIIASFRAPSTQFVMTLQRRLNPTAQILRASAFCRHHDYIFALLCMLNVNMGVLNMAQKDDPEDTYATELLQQLTAIYVSMDATKQARVGKRVMFSGALPISRDTESYMAIMSILDGGVAGQLEYAAQGGGNPALASTMGLTNDHSEFLDSRAEAKRAHAERMQLLRQQDNNSSSLEQQQHLLGAGAGAEPKQSAFSIAVSVANAADQKDAKGGDVADAKGGAKEGSSSLAAVAAGAEQFTGDPTESNRFRLLGDLPTLGKGGASSLGGRGSGSGGANVAVALSLALHNNENQADKKYQFMKGAAADSKNGDGGSSGGNSRAADSKDAGPILADARDASIPKEFLCAINGHVMKDPVRVPSTGIVFELSTIELWLKNAGSVCPITNTPLERSQLVPDDELRNRIKRYHIQQTSMRQAAEVEDDLYDF